MFEVNLPFIFIYSSFCHLLAITGYGIVLAVRPCSALNMKRHSAHLLESTASWCVHRNFVVSFGYSKSFLQYVVFPSDTGVRHRDKNTRFIYHFFCSISEYHYV